MVAIAGMAGGGGVTPRLNVVVVVEGSAAWWAATIGRLARRRGVMRCWRGANGDGVGGVFGKPSGELTWRGGIRLSGVMSINGQMILMPCDIRRPYSCRRVDRRG